MTTEIRTRTVQYTVTIHHPADPATDAVAYTTVETRFRVETYEVDILDTTSAGGGDDIVPANARL